MTDWLLVGLGAFGFALQMFSLYRVNRALRRMIERINEGKHWSEHQFFMEFELNILKWERIKRAYREADPGAPLIPETLSWVRLMFLGLAIAVSALAMWGYEVVLRAEPSRPELLRIAASVRASGG